jgi:DNA gyrase/topoisomerase IV subunit A
MNDATSETPLTRFLAEQTVAQLRGLKAQYRDELDSIKHRSDVLEAEVERIEQALREKSGSRRRTKVSAKTAANGRKRRSEPALWELILSVMRQRAGPWTRQEIYEALDKTGHAPKGKNPTNVIGNRLLELVDKHEVRRAGRGAFEVSRGSTGMDRNQLFTGNAIQEAESEDV